MKRISLFFALLFLTVACSNVVKTEKETPYLVVVSLDGFRWDYPTMTETPNLDSIAATGVKARAMIPSFPTKTFPNHYTLATGLYPDHHGIVMNSFYDPEKQVDYHIMDRDKVTNADFYGGEPIWVTASTQGVKSASYYWVGSEAPVKGHYPDYWKEYKHDVPFENRIDTVIHWLQMPEEKRPHLVMLYLHEPDHIGHVYGPESDTLKQTVHYLDSLMGILSAKLNQLPIAGRINLIILSDHGMAQLSEEKVIRIDDEINADWFDKIIGGNPNYTFDVKDKYADTAFAVLSSIPHMRVWKKGQLPERLHYGTHERTLDFIAVADSGWSILRKGQRYGAATHGFDNEFKDMLAIFYASGPAFKNNYKMKAFANVNVYPLMAHILGLIPAETDGHIDSVKSMLVK